MIVDPTTTSAPSRDEAAIDVHAPGARSAQHAMSPDVRPSLVRCVLSAVVVHTVTYSLVGMIAYSVMDYPSLFAEEGLRDLMLPTSEPRMAFAPAFQILRGALYGVLVHRLHVPIVGEPRGWATLWLLLVAVGILGTFGPAPGSLEGMFFTTVPLSAHVRGWPEVVLQSMLFSVVLTYWLRHPSRRWIGGALGAMFVLAWALPILGSLAAG